MTGDSPLVRVEDLSVRFSSAQGTLRAVDVVSLDLHTGTTAALVGESGCGKTLTALSLARLLPGGPEVQVAGRIRYREAEVLAMTARELRGLRGGRISYVFQEVGTALNPSLRIGRQVTEAVRAHRPELDARGEAVRLLNRVGLPDAERRMCSYPHELSGGMQQRVMIAMAMASGPELLVADEPTTALDVTIQAQILELMRAVQRQTRMAVLLITHNLGLVADWVDSVHVMYAGRIVEAGAAEAVLTRPRHPYTRGLLAAVPRAEPGAGAGPRLEGIKGAVPNPARLPPGCKFADRCARAKPVCHATEPGWTPADGEPGRGVRCWLPL